MTYVRHKFFGILISKRSVSKFFVMVGIKCILLSTIFRDFAKVEELMAIKCIQKIPFNDIQNFKKRYQHSSFLNQAYDIFD